MKVVLISNNDCTEIDVAEGATLARVFRKVEENSNLNDYAIQVNEAPVPADYQLHEGDRVSFTRRKQSDAPPAEVEFSPDMLFKIAQAGPGFRDVAGDDEDY